MAIIMIDPNPDAQLIIEQTRASFADLERRILHEIPENRERSLALTNLEQAAMWATKACLTGQIMRRPP